MKTKVALALLLALPVQAQAADLKDFVTVGIAASNAADYATTRIALRRPGLYETNNVMDLGLNREPLGLGLKAGTTALEVFAVRKLMANPKHRTLGIILGIAVIGANSYLAIHNGRKAFQ